MVLIEDKIEILNRLDLIRMILRIKGVQYSINLSDAHINLLIDIYINGNELLTYEDHISRSLELKNYFKSMATIENAKSYFRKNGILKKNDQGDLLISPDFLPPVSELLVKDSLLLNIKIFNDK